MGHGCDPKQIHLHGVLCVPTDERNFEWLRDLVLSMRDDLAAIKARLDNQETHYSRNAAWILGALSAAIAVASILVNIWINAGAP